MRRLRSLVAELRQRAELTHGELRPHFIRLAATALIGVTLNIELVERHGDHARAKTCDASERQYRLYALASGRDDQVVDLTDLLVGSVDHLRADQRGRRLLARLQGALSVAVRRAGSRAARAVVTGGCGTGLRGRRALLRGLRLRASGRRVAIRYGRPIGRANGMIRCCMLVRVTVRVERGPRLQLV